MSRQEVRVDGLSIFEAPDVEMEEIAALPVGTVVDADDTVDDAGFARVRVAIEDREVDGWAIARYLAPIGRGAERPASNSRFNTERRRDYLDSIIAEDADARNRFNFLRASRQAWDHGTWFHGYVKDGTRYSVGAKWATSQNEGRVEITSPTTSLSGTAFAARFGAAQIATFCNFNVSHCYQQAYGGSNLQDPNGTLPGGERNANRLVDYLRAEWREVPPDEAAKIAHTGGFVVAGWKNPGGHGHVVFLLEHPSGTPVLDGDEISCFHVGSGAPRLTTVGGAFGSHSAAVRFFVDPATLEEWHATEHLEPLAPPVAPPELEALGAAPAGGFSVDTDLKTVISPLSANDIDGFLLARSSPLAGIGAAAIAAAQKYSINASYIVAHAALETGWGTSSIYRLKNNLFGWSAFDASPFASSKKFPNRETCIDFVMGRIDALYLTVGGKFFVGAPCLGDKHHGMNVSYASDPQWGAKIASIARKIETSA